MITITKSFEWDMGHRVTNHKSACKNLHGHRYKMIVELGGKINTSTGSSSQGMIIDFGDIKKLISENVVAQLDHAFMYWDDDKTMNEFAKSHPELKWSKVSFVPTAENIAAYVAEQLQALCSDNFASVTLVSVTINETPSSQAVWRLAHD